MSKFKKMLMLSATVLGLATVGISAVSADEIIPQGNGTVLVASEPMTAEQILARYMDDFNVDRSQAMRDLGINPYERAARTYRTLSQRFFVTNTYYPAINFYCETSEGGGHRGLLRIMRVELDRTYGANAKAFSGSVYSNLENANSIFYIVNGDYFNHGTTTASAGVSIGMGEAASVEFGASYASSHYASKYHQGRIFFR